MSAPIEVSLRPATHDDVAAFWRHQLANRAEAATGEQQQAFVVRWRSILDNVNAPVRTILAGGTVVGYMAHFQRRNLPEVSYELGRPHWGKGFATAALRQFLREITVRPLYARAAKDNLASIRVLEKCGFAGIDEDRFTDATGHEHEEFIFELR